MERLVFDNIYRVVSPQISSAQHGFMILYDFERAIGLSINNQSMNNLSITS